MTQRQGDEERKAKLEAALRANLKRRKAQARAREEEAAPPPAVEEPPPIT
jgi:hypothetical protein